VAIVEVTQLVRARVDQEHRSSERRGRITWQFELLFCFSFKKIDLKMKGPIRLKFGQLEVHQFAGIFFMSS
jgi:hypothetical protein